ncbi:energy-coupling factor ABC transporter ATP-binding protein [Roseovarius sp.]|uniref:energy-coupling factor ABC transporter ATP-binding protein n=1 Tax=Roseovarius sp. TaxID=1486281 RepID=UPI00356B5372
MSLLALHDVGIGWPDGPRVLDGLSLSVAPGERVGLVGPNGAGKSTLFQTLAAILPAQAGQIRFDGAPVQAGRFSPNLAMVFQNADDQLFCPTLAEDVAYGARNLSLPASEVAARTAQALRDCGLTGLEDRPVHKLSGGEKRRACIAGALVMRPAFMLLDEPSAALDLRQRRNLIDLLRGLPQAMIIASHDLDLLLALCPRVLLIDEGRLCADDPAETVLGDAALMVRHGQEVPAALAAR